MLLQTEHVSKEFNGIYALRDIDFQLDAGDIHGLVGENGAGKSTLIKLLTGVYQLREGRLLWNGEPVTISNPADSRALGIRVIHQDRTLIPTFNGIENCYLGLEYPTRLGRVDWAAMERRVWQTMEDLGIDLDLKKTAAELSPPQRTELEIVRAMMTDCRLLILDEPTASLTDQEAGRLFRLLRDLRQKGTSILYVTHRLDEIFLLTDRVTVLRNGRLVDTVPTASVTREQLIAKMTEQAAVEPVCRRETFGPVLLEVKDMASRDGRVKQGSLALHSGEILGLFGLGGSGRTELLECIFGYRALSAGTVLLDGKERPGLTPEEAIRSGMVLISEDRRGKAMIGNLSVRDNILLSSIDTFSRRGVLRTKAGNGAAEEQIESLHIKLASPNQRMLELSGGCQLLHRPAERLDRGPVPGAVLHHHPGHEHRPLRRHLPPLRRRHRLRGHPQELFLSGYYQAGPRSPSVHFDGGVCGAVLVFAGAHHPGPEVLRHRRQRGDGQDRRHPGAEVQDHRLRPLRGHGLRHRHADRLPRGLRQHHRR